MPRSDAGNPRLCGIERASRSLSQSVCSRDSSVTMSWLRLSCGHGICTAQHKPEGQAVCAAWPSPVLCLLRLTGTWAANSSVYNGPVIRITAAKNAHPSFPSSFYSLPCIPLTPHSFLCLILTSSFCALWQTPLQGFRS